MSEMDEALKEFLIECQENLSRVDLELLELEKSTDPELVKSIFRVMHTIKGSAGFLGLSKLEKLTHAGENLLSKIRDGQFKANQQITTTLLQVVDAIRLILESLEKDGSEGNISNDSLVENLHLLAEGGSISQAVAPSTPEKKQPENTTPPPSNPPEAASVNPQATMILESPLREAKLPATMISSIPADTSITDIIQENKNNNASPSIPAPSTSSSTIVLPANTEAPREIPGSLSDSSVRISVDVLDKLMALASELVLSRNQLLQCSNRLNDVPLLAASRQFNNVTSELQEALMKTRMQPIANVWNKFPRMVREVAFKLGKQISLEMEGADTELDKSLIEAIKDPLTHLVRNSIDHGIETADVRAKSGKPAEGKLLLRAYHESGQVNIVITDDGRGIDVDRVRAKALEKQLLSMDELSQMSENSVLQLIFLPGFSTAEKISNISGRGVGMDVVKSNIEKIGGMVDLQSERGKGTTIHLRIPLTLAIIKAITITSGGQDFAVPQAHITELLRLSGDRKNNSIEYVHNTPVIRFRGRLLPLLDLDRVLNPESRKESVPTANHLLVLQAEDKQFGLLVDSVRDTFEIVVKPLPNRLKTIGCFAGVTITGDGQVQLILDISGLARMGKVLPRIRDLGVREIASTGAKKDSGEASTGEGLLLVNIGTNGQIALPLEQVVRLEEFKTEQVEFSGTKAMIQYRGEILPLHSMAGMLAGSDTWWKKDDIGIVPVVVHKQGGRLFGLAVRKIVDTVYESILESGSEGRSGIRRTVVVQGRVTEYVDLNKLVSQRFELSGGGA
ncbi:MAG: chemotaxis protein CheW [Gemmataceae bacterium]